MSNFPASLAKLVRRCRRGHEWLPTSDPKMPCPFCSGKTPRVTKANFATVNSHSMAGVNNDWMRGGDALRRSA